MGFPVFIPSDQVLRNHETKSAETKVISQDYKKLEKTLKQQLSEEQRAFETKVFSGRKFSEIQKYLKAIRRNDGWPSNMKWGNNLAECPEEMAELLNIFRAFSLLELHKIMLTTCNRFKLIVSAP